MRGLHRTRLAFGKLLAQRAHKIEKPLPPRARVVFAELQKREQIFLALRPTAHRAEDAEHIAPAVNFTQQLAHAQVRRAVAQSVQRTEEFYAVDVLTQKQRIVEVTRALPRADRRELIGCKAEERRAQHGNERHVLPRIVDDLQEREQHCDLHRGKKVLARVSGAVEAARFQRAAIVQKACARRAHQYDDVLLAHGPQLFCFVILYRKFTCQHIADIVRDERGLSLARAHALLARLRRQIEQMELRAARARFDIIRAEAQHFIRAVVELTHFLGKNIAEDKIRRIQHFFARTEVAREQQLRAVVLLCVLKRRPGVIMLQKNTRVG